jgi:uroporphyrinogen-III decarboxylase
MPIGDIPRLLDRVRELTETPANRARHALWQQPIQAPARAEFSPYFPVFPTPATAGGRIPFTFDLEPSLWGRILDLDLGRVYSEPAAYLEFMLRAALYQFEQLPSDLPLTRHIHFDFGSVFLAALFGVAVITTPGEAPWISYDPVWKSEADFAAARCPDFHAGGLSPLAHRFYAEMRRLAGDDFHVDFLLWRKGPFALLTHLRGYSQILLDIYDRPAFVHEMMAFIVEAMKRWCEERRAFLGEDHYSAIWLGNDEVGTPTVSPAMYEEFILPYETEISRFFGGIDYWHSCGDTTALLPKIARLPALHMLDIGPWTDLAAAVKLYREQNAPFTSIMRRINPIECVISASEAEMRAPLTEVRRLCAGVVPTVVQYNGLNYVDDWQRDLAQIRRLPPLCAEILHAPAG